MNTNNTKPCWLSKTIASCFGIGYFPWAPGTVASIVTSAFAFLFVSNVKIIWIWDIEIFLIFLLLGLVSGTDLIKHQAIKDPAWFVMDEVAGMWLSLLLLPKDNLWLVLTALVAFRLCDITKPWLIRKAEKIPGATGIMMDDILAAVPAWLITFTVWKLL